MVMVTLLLLSILIVWFTSKPCVHPLLNTNDQEVMDALAPQQAAEGNHMVLITDFNQMIDTMIADIDQAKDHVHVEFFKFESDAVSQRLGAALSRKAQEGVEARLMYDDLMTLSHHWYFAKLRKQGVETQGFGRLSLPLIHKRDNYRNHRKVIVIDGRVAYLGGMNIADRYSQGLSWGRWQDTMTRIEGPAVAQLQKVFLSDWRYASGNLLVSPRYFPKLTHRGENSVEVLTSGPIGPGPDIMHKTIELLDNSKQYAYLESPYLIPTNEVMEALCRTAQRGVDVRILIPPRGDRGVLTPWASRSFIDQALEAGIKVGFYKAGYLHTKSLVMDDKVAMTTSCNIDVRSYVLDLEVAAIATGGDYVAQAKAAFEADETSSEYLNLDDWRHRPWTNHIGEQLSRLLKNQL